MTAPVAHLKEVSVRRRGRRVLGPLTHSLAPEGLTTVLGPNGAGKTTLLKVLHGIERLSTGRLDWGMPPREAQALQAYVFQSPVMLRRTVRQNLAYPLRLRGTARAEIDRDVAHWAEAVGITPLLSQRASGLSGGEKQKLALARALIRRPRILFLDEPCSYLDGATTRDIEAILRDALAQGTRIIMSTHDLGQARRLATDVLFLHRGALVEATPRGDFFDSPTTPEARAFLKGDILP